MQALTKHHGFEDLIRMHGSYSKPGGFMEDNSKSKIRSDTAAAGNTKVIDLTPEMVLSADASGKIIDLTNVLHSQAAQPEQTAPRPPEPSTSVQPQADRRNSAADDFEPAVIEEEVDAAFEAFQDSTSTVAKQQKSETEDEKLQELTEMADSAVRQAATEAATPAMSEATAEPLQTVDDSPASLQSSRPDPQTPNAAAELARQPVESDPSQHEFTAGPTDENDEEPIELTDTVDPELVQMAKPAQRLDQGSGEDEVIDLLEVVNPAELTDQSADQEAMPAESGDDEIIELNDIVDPTELGLPALSVDDTEEVIELTDIVDPQELPPASLVSKSGPTPDADLNANDQVIQLADVLNTVRRNDEPRSDGITMGLDEDLAADASAKAEDDGAGALGLELDKEFSEGSTAVADKEIEETIERIIRTKYAQQIERLIAQAVEKAVTREIKNIKRAIMDDSDPHP